ncbi:DUF1269 domain-containing protein [Barrientosiimonas endolithica]|uniref:DUF1269 domain-containing protein n=1 Tax=Barrientosiimonas endolithica TaxID=1535208 RepID=A0ABN6YRU2_9MICO|nr:DUF1269 domain-containing protein [Barrientosiimonas endolithica]BDZ59856.1 hypothetical protein GCM10025872_35130 [Barrientosiimonas endolithica]
MSEKNIVLMSWDDSSKAYEAFSKFRDLDSGGVQVDSSAVIERTQDGRLRVTDGQDNEIGLGTLGGGGLGALIGVLGGPLGMLLGFASGSLIGSTLDVDRAFDSDSVVSEMSRALPPGRTAIVAEVQEASPEAIDGFAQETGAVLLRRPLEVVLDEIAAGEEAADAAARAADEKVREAKKAERKEKRDERIAAIKAKF